MIKSGYLTYFSRGTFSKKWKEGFFKLFDSGTIQWYEDVNDNKPVGVSNLNTIKDYICVGENTRKVPGRPSLIASMNEQYLMCFPRDLARKENEVCWIFFKNQAECNEWSSVMIGLINPQKQPQMHSNPQVYLPEGFNNQGSMYQPQQTYNNSDQPPPYPANGFYPTQQMTYPVQYPVQYPQQHQYAGQYRQQPQTIIYNMAPPPLPGQYNNNNNDEVALAMLAGYHMGYHGFGPFGFGGGWGSFL